MPSSDKQQGVDLSEIERLYTEGPDQHGVTSLSVGWNDAHSHELRFSQLVQLIERQNGAPEGFSVGDFGCGYGALFPFLSSRYNSRLQSYTGYDISQRMVDLASENVRDPRAAFCRGAELAVADYYFVCGTFNVRMENDRAAWCQWVETTLASLARVSRRGLAFNLLSTHVDWEKEQLFYANPLDFFAIAKTKLSHSVALLHDYPLYEWTMLVDMRDNYRIAPLSQGGSEELTSLNSSNPSA